MQKNRKTVIVYIVLAAGLMFGLYMLTQTIRGSMQPTTKYSEIVELFREDQIKEFSLDLGNRELVAVLRDGVPFENAQTASNDERVVTYKVPSVNVFLDDVKDYIRDNAVQETNGLKWDYSYTSDNTALLFQYIPMLLIAVGMIIFFIVMMRQAGAGGKMNQFGKSNMKNPVQHSVKTTFSDVAGADEEVEELHEIVDFLKNPKKFDELGARIPKGCLLLGPPGTGKTLLARAVAGEAGVPFFSISGSDFVEMFVGVGASRVRDLFENAKKNAPSIVFIDEIDAVGRHRGAGLGGGHDEREQTLNQLLVEMDGFGPNQGVIVIAATNRRDILDPALLRPGRFDRQIVVNYPDVRGREEILKIHSKKKPLGFDVDLKSIARSTAGFTGADLENLLNEAALLAARRGKKAITGTDIEEATIKVVAGPEKKSHKVHLVDKRITAYHEAGHAVVCYYSETQDPVHEISIIPRGMAAGYTLNLPDEDRSHVSKQKMMESLAMLLGGRVAEQVALDDICTGASNDIERATKTARDMVMKYGFSSRLGPIVYGEAQGEVFLGKDMGHQRNYSENVAAEIDEEVRLLIDNAYENARTILSEHFDQLDLVAKYLLVHEKIDDITFKKLMNGKILLDSFREDYDKFEEMMLTSRHAKQIAIQGGPESGEPQEPLQLGEHADTVQSETTDKDGDSKTDAQDSAGDDAQSENPSEALPEDDVKPVSPPDITEEASPDDSQADKR